MPLFRTTNPKTGLLDPEEEHDLLEPTLLRTAKRILSLNLPPGHAFVPRFPSYTRLTLWPWKWTFK